MNLLISISLLLAISASSYSNAEEACPLCKNPDLEEEQTLEVQNDESLSDRCNTCPNSQSEIQKIQCAIEELQLPINAVSSTLKFKVEDSGSCSGIKVSKNGHILSAAHCFKSCLEKNSKSEVKAKYLGTLIKKYSLPSTSLKCKVTVDHKELTVEIIALNYCSPRALRYVAGMQKISPTDNMLPNEFSNCDQSPDIIVFKPLTSSLDAKGCYPITIRDKWNIGETITTIGFPGKTFRQNRTNSDGESLYFASGPISSTTSGVLTVKSDGHGGMSGGPAFDNAFNLVGIQFEGDKNTFDNVGTRSNIIPLSSLSNLRKKDGTRYISSDLSCN